MTPLPQNTPAPRRRSFPKTGEVCADGAVMPVRMRLSRRPGADLQIESRKINGLSAVVVGRPSVYGDPFTVASARAYLADVRDAGLHTREETAHAIAVRWFEEWLAGDATLAADVGRRPPDRDRIRILRGKNLACWCALPAPGEPDHCHAAVLLRLANVRCDEPAPAQGGPAL